MSNPFGPLYTFEIVVLLGCAILFYKAADMEDQSTVIWSGLSVGLYLLTLCLLGWGLLGNLLAQAGLMIAIVGVRMVRDRLHAK
jgi:hypothetical protein